MDSKEGMTRTERILGIAWRILVALLMFWWGYMAISFSVILLPTIIDWLDVLIDSTLSGGGVVGVLRLVPLWWLLSWLVLSSYVFWRAGKLLASALVLTRIDAWVARTLKRLKREVLKP